MTENKKITLIVGIMISVAVCTAGFTSRAETLQAEKSFEGTIIEIIEESPEIGQVDNISIHAVQIFKDKAAEKQQLAAAEEKRLREEEEARRKAASQAEKELLASIIFCEAGNQPYEGQVAVGAVVMNRVRSSSFPNTIEAVIYQSGQFSPASSGWLDRIRGTGGYTSAAMQAAGDALAGVNPVGSCLYFDRGGNGMQIGDHYFY